MWDHNVELRSEALGRIQLPQDIGQLWVLVEHGRENLDSMKVGEFSVRLNEYRYLRKQSMEIK
jgi:hypothetical protein